MAKQPKIKISERDLQASIIQWLQAKKFFYYRQNTGVAKMGEEGRYVRFGNVGSPDIVVVRNGIYIGIEVKGTNTAWSLEQKGFKEKLEDAGGTYILARRMEDVTEHIDLTK
jgi:hypothetical protein